MFAIWQPKAYRYKYNTQLIFTVTLQWAWNVKQRIWKCSYLSMSTKVHLYQALVMSVLLYGSLDTPGCRHRHARSAFIWSASGRCSTSTGGTISPMQRYSRKQACQQSAKSYATQPSPVSFRPCCTLGPWSPSKQGEQSWGQEAIVKLDQTSGPSSSHLAQPCPGGC